jgi:uncharacterized NAD(P)/FAD-binding protein YdhS
VPQPHRSQNVSPSYSHLPPSLIACEPSAVDFLRAIRQHVRILDRSGVDWREVMASLRPLTPRLWQLLDSRERGRFLRHLRPFWDVHRHRVAPDLYRTFEALRADGELRTRAARILDLRERDGLVHATLRGRGTTAEDVSAYGCVVNCTGPAGDVRTLEDPLITQLLGRGLATPDAHGLGLEVTEDLALVDRDGRASRVLSLVGPLLRGAFWEATAVPELRQHAARVATRLHAMLEGLAPNEAPTAQRARAMTSAG